MCTRYRTVAGASLHGKWVGVCGALASDPLATPVLIGLGVAEQRRGFPRMWQGVFVLKVLGRAHSNTGRALRSPPARALVIAP